MLHNLLPYQNYCLSCCPSYLILTSLLKSNWNLWLANRLKGMIKIRDGLWIPLGHDTNNCWALKHKVQDLIYSGATSIVPSSLKISVPIFHLFMPLFPSLHMISTYDFLFDPSKLLIQNCNLCLCQTKQFPNVAPINYSPTNPYWWPIFPKPQSLSQNVAKQTISPAPKPKIKPVFRIGGNGYQ